MTVIILLCSIVKSCLSRETLCPVRKLLFVAFTTNFIRIPPTHATTLQGTLSANLFEQVVKLRLSFACSGFHFSNIKENNTTSM